MYIMLLHLQYKRFRGPMDKALVYETRDSGFDPQRSRFYVFFSFFTFFFAKPLASCCLIGAQNKIFFITKHTHCVVVPRRRSVASN